MSDLKHYQLIAQPSMEPQTVIDLWSTPENIDALERTLRRLVFPYAFQLYVAAVPTEMTQIPKTRDYAGMFPEKEVSTHTPVFLEDVQEFHRRKAAADAVKFEPMVSKKPPLGLMPLYLWRECNPSPNISALAQRAIEVAQAVQRYYEAGELVNPEWLSEIGIRGVRPNVNPQFWDRNIIRPTGRDPAQTTGGSGQESPEGK